MQFNDKSGAIQALTQLSGYYKGGIERYITGLDLSLDEIAAFIEIAKRIPDRSNWMHDMMRHELDFRVEHICNPKWQSLITRPVHQWDISLVKQLPDSLFSYFTKTFPTSRHVNILKVLRCATRKKDIAFARGFLNRRALNTPLGCAADVRLDKLASEVFKNYKTFVPDIVRNVITGEPAAFSW